MLAGRDEARGAAIQTLRETRLASRPGAGAPEIPLDARRERVTVMRGSGMYGEARRFVHHQEVVVFVDDIRCRQARRARLRRFRNIRQINSIAYDQTRVRLLFLAV